MTSKFKFSKFILLSISFITKLEAVTEVSSHQELLTNLKNSNKDTVLDAYASWCPPCKAAAPKFEKLSKKYNNVNFVKIDADKNPETRTAFSIGAFPTFLFFKAHSTKPVKTISGTNDLEKEIKNLANARPEEQAQPQINVEEMTVQEEQPSPVIEEVAVEEEVKKPEVKEETKPSVSSGKVSKIKSKKDFDNLLKDNKTSIIEVVTNHCQFCKYMENPLDQMADDYRNVNFAKVDLADFPEIEDDYGPFQGYPTFLVFKNGELINSFIGATQSEDANKSILENRLSDVLGLTTEPIREVVVEQPEKKPAKSMTKKETKTKKNNKYKIKK